MSFADIICKFFLFLFFPHNVYSGFVISGIYGAMALAGRFICSITGIDSMGGFNPSFDAILQGLGYAAPPIMALLLILDVRFDLLLKRFKNPFLVLLLF